MCSVMFSRWRFELVATVYTFLRFWAWFLTLNLGLYRYPFPFCAVSIILQRDHWMVNFVFLKLAFKKLYCWEVWINRQRCICILCFWTIFWQLFFIPASPFDGQCRSFMVRGFFIEQYGGFICGNFLWVETGRSFWSRKRTSFRFFFNY